MTTTTISQVHEDEFHRIFIEHDFSLLRLTWKQHPDSEQYRNGYRRAIQAGIENKVQYWLTDSRKISYLHMADQHWMYSKMRPLLKGGKLKRMAIVLQPETLMMTDRYPLLNNPGKSPYTDKLFNLEFFLDMESAHSWLLKGEDIY